MRHDRPSRIDTLAGCSLGIAALAIAGTGIAVYLTVYFFASALGQAAQRLDEWRQRIEADDDADTPDDIRDRYH